MVPSNFGYSLRECGHHFRRNWTTVLGAVVTIFLSLFIIGLFMLGSAMLTNLMGTVEDGVTIQAFLSDDADQATIDSFKATVEGWDNVESVTYKSKEEALEEYRTSMSKRNAADAIEALDGENPLPASLVIKMNDSEQVQAMAEKLIADSTFATICDDASDVSSNVNYGGEVVERLFSVTNYIQIGAMALVVLLTFVAFVFINNTIRLAITARRREIGIMRLVGASNSFIRGPFVTEGTLEALIGAILAIVALYFGMNALIPALQSSMSFLSFDVADSTMYATFGVIVVVGVVIGLFGSIIAMRRYLKV